MEGSYQYTYSTPHYVSHLRSDYPTTILQSTNKDRPNGFAPRHVNHSYYHSQSSAAEMICTSVFGSEGFDDFELCDWKWNGKFVKHDCIAEGCCFAHNASQLCATHSGREIQTMSRRTGTLLIAVPFKNIEYRKNFNVNINECFETNGLFEAIRNDANHSSLCIYFAKFNACPFGAQCNSIHVTTRIMYRFYKSCPFHDMDSLYNGGPGTTECKICIHLYNQKMFSERQKKGKLSHSASKIRSKYSSSHNNNKFSTTVNNYGHSQILFPSAVTSQTHSSIYSPTSLLYSKSPSPFTTSDNHCPMYASYVMPSSMNDHQTSPASSTILSSEDAVVEENNNTTATSKCTFNPEYEILSASPSKDRSVNAEGKDLHFLYCMTSASSSFLKNTDFSQSKINRRLNQIETDLKTKFNGFKMSESKYDLLCKRLTNVKLLLHAYWELQVFDFAVYMTVLFFEQTLASETETMKVHDYYYTSYLNNVSYCLKSDFSTVTIHQDAHLDRTENVTSDDNINISSDLTPSKASITITSLNDNDLSHIDTHTKIQQNVQKTGVSVQDDDITKSVETTPNNISLYRDYDMEPSFTVELNDEISKGCSPEQSLDSDESAFAVLSPIYDKTESDDEEFIPKESLSSSAEEYSLSSEDSLLSGSSMTDNSDNNIILVPRRSSRLNADRVLSNIRRAYFEQPSSTRSRNRSGRSLPRLSYPRKR